MLYEKLLATIVYINKNIANAQPRLRGQVKVSQPHYYTSISMNTKKKKKKWFDKVVNTMEQCNICSTQCKTKCYCYTIVKLG